MRVNKIIVHLYLACCVASILSGAIIVIIDFDAWDWYLQIAGNVFLSISVLSVIIYLLAKATGSYDRTRRAK